MAESAAITVVPVTGVIGAEVRGLDLRRPMTDEQRHELRSALLRHHVLFFRGQPLTEDEQLAVATQFADPMVPNTGGGGYGSTSAQASARTSGPFVTLQDTDESPPKADHWHSDVPFAAEPPEFAVLHMLSAPDVGGDTMWVNMHAVFDRLSPTMQSVLAPLEVLVGIGTPVKHGYLGTPGGEERYQQLLRETPPTRHPLVRIHPETGRPSLFYPGVEFVRGIAGMHPAESDVILGYLRSRLDDPNCQVRWRWSEHDVVIWDERCTNHRALSDHYPRYRCVRRCLAGQSAPRGAPATAGAVP